MATENRTDLTVLDGYDLIKLTSLLTSEIRRTETIIGELQRCIEPDDSVEAVGLTNRLIDSQREHYQECMALRTKLRNHSALYQAPF